MVVLFTLGYFYPLFGILGRIGLLALSVLFITDILLLYLPTATLEAGRSVPQRLSNGDQNQIGLKVTNHYPFACSVRVIDELPYQFQVRDHRIDLMLDARSTKELFYQLRPTERGEYQFGRLNCYGHTPLRLVRRRHTYDEDHTVPVYPSFLQMRKFEIYAISNRLTDLGVKKIRRVGHTMEFDQIREYVPGDDYRSINWKATARRGDLMVNQYRDERSQQVYNLLDMGRVMKMPFEGLKLLDYAINTSLVISNISLIKQDRAGLVTFADTPRTVVAAQGRRTHIYKIQEALYNVETDFRESSFEKLYILLKNTVRQRSLLLLYTNFETLSSMRRQLPYLQKIASDHLLVTIFFKNTELDALLEMEPENDEQIYIKTIAEKFAYEKREIVKELNRHGIQTILTPPRELAVETINKYLELKARGLI
ncbi:MAG: DUF58 domain-containing protein [Balneolaceae bacterium]|nr:DUF58 domain-containing protein [Balneolaceae bacterium]